MVKSGILPRIPGTLHRVTLFTAGVAVLIGGLLVLAAAALWVGRR